MILLCGLAAGIKAAEPQKIVYHNAAELTIINKAHPGKPSFRRVDTDRYPNLSERVSRFYDYSTGLAVIFRTDSRNIHARWNTAEHKMDYNKTAVAVKGMDLYIRRDGEWVFAGFAKPEEGLAHESPIVENMDEGMKECLMYLPLYDRLESLEIGVDEGTVIEAVKNPFRHKIIVAGSSITHGASASRPGLTYPALLERTTGFEFSNLGVSGRFKLDSFFLPVLSDAECDAIIIDAFSNPSARQIEERLEIFVEGLAESHPDIPLIFLQTLIRETGNFDVEKRASEQAKRETAEKLMRRLMKEYKNVYFISPGIYTGTDHEGTIDGIHPTDLGFDRMIRKLKPQLLRIFHRYGIK